MAAGATLECSFQAGHPDACVGIECARAEATTAFLAAALIRQMAQQTPDASGGRHRRDVEALQAEAVQVESLQ
jgi:hypothetical protein